MPMRRPLSIVLVLLLVLRGLLGDAMAMGAAPVMGVPTPAVASASDSALHHHAPEIAQSPDSHERHLAHATEQPSHTSHAEHSADCSSQAGGPAGGSCGEHEHGPSCTLCGICHSALFTPGQIGSDGAAPSAALRPQGSTRFASAAKLQAIKPPIS
ncbi:hypothetical protein JC796_06585 [Delftia acidovorans]|uniref:hypothetical protein n=1 Tax=Delftia acidovorans TaxID=80866 RepID=UPI0018E73B18|nr:hypothetical protein [Delftia acidovorans]MBJ2140387.1 hypothetical protein [Delftia acidovorans]